MLSVARASASRAIRIGVSATTDGLVVGIAVGFKIHRRILGRYAFPPGASLMCRVTMRTVVSSGAESTILFVSTASRSSSVVDRTAAWLSWILAIASIARSALAIGPDAHGVQWTLDGYFGVDATRAHTRQFGPGGWAEI